MTLGVSHTLHRQRAWEAQVEDGGGAAVDEAAHGTVRNYGCQHHSTPVVVFDSEGDDVHRRSSLPRPLLPR
jgi:hypothetical protein